MSLIRKSLKFFSGAGFISIVPLSLTLSGQKLEIYNAGGAKEIKSESKQEGVMEQAARLMKKEGNGEDEGKDEKRCFWLPDSKGWELFMCVFMKKLSPLFLFHYDRRNQLGLEKRLNQVSEIDYKGSNQATMKFKDGKSVNMTHTLKISLAWLRKWEATLNPENNCKIAKKSDSSKEYTLTCDVTNKKSGSSAWARHVTPETI